MISDTKAVGQLIKGNVSAYEFLFRKYYGTVYCFVRNMLKDRSAAEDIAQNIFMRIWLNRASLHPDKPIKHLLFVMAKNEALMAKNEALDVLKSKYSKSALLSTDVHDKELENGDADKRVMMLETASGIKDIIAKLPPQRRTVFVLSRYNNLSNKEIAGRLGLSVRTVEKHLELALRELRTALHL